MLTKVIEILSAFTELPPESITESSDLINDLGLNSLDMVSVVVAFEDEFGMEIPDRMLKELHTVGDILHLIEKLG